jgi:hypothetical protein
VSSNFQFVAAIGMFLALLFSVAGYSYFQNRRRSSPVHWEDLVAKLTWIDRNHIAEVALDLVDESGQPKTAEGAGSMEPARMWKLIGGLEGLGVLERNSKVLIDLAFYVQQRYPEALSIAERLRLDARQLQWHVTRLRAAAKNGNLQVSFPFYAQRAVLSYYMMTRRLLLLCETGNLAMLADLQKAL